MASRTIAIRIVVDSRNSVTDIDKVNDALSRFESRTRGATHLQAGLTNSFIKGNLAARAISVAYLSIRDSLSFATKEGINFQHEMLKISAITETAGVPLESLTNTIRRLAAANRQSQNVLAQTALEMGKLGLSGRQVEEALTGVAQLGRALDENLVETGKAVVAVINAYGFAAKDAGRISDQLAFTVKASALDINSFATAFSYVGGTAKAAGLSIEDLQAAMDVLSNSGIRASTIGTQLRRILTDLSNENSKASAILGGKTLKDYESFADVLFDLGQKGLTASDYAAVFGRTASSVIKILVDQNATVRDFSKATSEANGVTKQMADIMNTSLKSSLEGLKVAFGDLGIEVVDTAEGPLKLFTDMVTGAVKQVTGFLQIFKTSATFTEMMQYAEYAKRFREEAEKIRHYSPQMHGVSDSYLAQHTKVFRDFTKAVQDREDIVGKLSEIIDKEQAVAYQLARGKGQATMPANLFTDQKELERLMNLPGLTPEKWTAALDEALRKAGIANVVESDESELDRLKAIKKENDIIARQNAQTLEYYKDLYHWLIKVGEFESVGFDRRLNPQQPGAFKPPAFQTGVDLSDMGGGKGDKQSNDTVKWYQEAHKAAEEAHRLTMEMVLLDQVMRDFGNGVEQVGYQFGESMVSALTGGGNAFKEFDTLFGDIAKHIIANLVAMTAKMLVFGAVARAMGLGGFGSFGFTSGTTAQNIILSALGGTLKQATGGTREVNQPTLFVAGESGPETVSVTPRAKARQSSQSSIQVVIQGDVMDGEKFMEAVKLAEKKLNRRRV